MKFAAARPYADAEKAARRLMEHARAFEPIQDGRIYIEKINGPFLFNDNASGIWRWPSPRDPARLARDARIRNLRDVRAGH